MLRANPESDHSISSRLDSARKRADLLLLTFKDGLQFRDQKFQTFLSFGHRPPVIPALVGEPIDGLPIPPRLNAFVVENSLLNRHRSIVTSCHTDVRHLHLTLAAVW